MGGDNRGLDAVTRLMHMHNMLILKSHEMQFQFREELYYNNS